MWVNDARATILHFLTSAVCVTNDIVLIAPRAHVGPGFEEVMLSHMDPTRIEGKLHAGPVYESFHLLAKRPTNIERYALKSQFEQDVLTSTLHSLKFLLLESLCSFPRQGLQ